MGSWTSIDNLRNRNRPTEEKDIVCHMVKDTLRRRTGQYQVVLNLENKNTKCPNAPYMYNAHCLDHRPQTFFFGRRTLGDGLWLIFPVPLTFDL